MNSSGTPLDTASIVSTVLEGILYGLSVLMFTGTIWALTYRRTHCRVINKRMITVACLLLLFSTAHIVICVVRAYEGLVLYRDSPLFGGPIGFFFDVSQWSFVCKSIIYMLQTLVGDAVVIHRCHIVWQSRWITVLPIALWVSVAVTGVGCVYFDSQATSDRKNIFAPSTGPWVIAFLAATLLTNVVSTSLLAFRIWKVGKWVGRMSSRTGVLWPVLRIVLDAGILYSVSLLAALLCFVAKDWGYYVMIDMITPIISITFYMVIIRIAIARSSPLGVVQPTSSVSGPLTFARSCLPPEREYSMTRMEVHITQLTETNDRGPYGNENGVPRGDAEREEDRDVDEVAAGKALGGFAV